jgi:hypothetical protein
LARTRAGPKGGAGPPPDEPLLRPSGRSGLGVGPQRPQARHRGRLGRPRGRIRIPIWLSVPSDTRTFVVGRLPGCEVWSLPARRQVMSSLGSLMRTALRCRFSALRFRLPAGSDAPVGTVSPRARSRRTRLGHPRGGRRVGADARYWARGADLRQPARSATGGGGGGRRFADARRVNLSCSNPQRRASRARELSGHL